MSAAPRLNRPLALNTTGLAGIAQISVHGPAGTVRFDPERPFVPVEGGTYVVEIDPSDPNFFTPRD